MSLQVNDDDAVVINHDSLEGAPAIVVNGDRVDLTNAAELVSSSSSSIAAIVLNGIDTTLFNHAFARIESLSGSPFRDAIRGSNGSDIVINEGIIAGEAVLAGGTDSFTERGSTSSVHLGAGNDVYRFETTDATSPGFVNGGDGWDRFIIASGIGQLSGAGVRNFERLELGKATLVEGFSGLRSVVQAPGGVNEIRNSANPNASITMVSGDSGLNFYSASLTLGPGTVFRSVIGSEGNDRLTMHGSSGEQAGASITGSIDLGAGADAFNYLHDSTSASAPTIAGTVSGGAGGDRLGIQVETYRTLDLTPFSGFEQLLVDGVGSNEGDVRLTHADGFNEIQVGLGRYDSSAHGTYLTLGDSYSPKARLDPGPGSRIVLEGTTTILWVSGGASNVVKANPANSFTLINHGSILGGVVLGSGHDEYDGRFGHEGGPVSGNAGDDTIRTGAGRDWIDGGLGADTMAGGAGDDSYWVDDAGDIVIEQRWSGYDEVRSSISFTLPLYVELLSLTGSAPIDGTGNQLANTLYGNEGDNVLDGGGGADRMEGGNGSDVFYVDHPQDRVSDSGWTGTDLVYSSVSFTLAPGVDALTLTGSAAINGTGSLGDDVIVGNGAANVLNGKAGADTMRGNGGDDIYHVDNHGDRVIETAAAGGTDAVNSTVSFRLGAHLENLTLLGTAAEGIGNALDNILTGNAAANILRGGAGDDAIVGGRGADQLFGGDGNDDLTGGAGADGFRFTVTPDAATNRDTIHAFSVLDDTIFLSRDIFTGIAGGTLAPGAFRAGTAALDAGDRILYDVASGRIFYDPDGTGAAAAVLFATVDAGTPLTHADFVGFS